MAKELKIWNGRGYCCRKTGDAHWAAIRTNVDVHAYVAAYSRADARRVIEEYSGRDPGDTELKVYWCEGTWGNAMQGVTPERGLWLGFAPQKPERVL